LFNYSTLWLLHIQQTTGNIAEAVHAQARKSG